jgi:hypothetical protein
VSGETHLRHRITPDGFYRGKRVIEKPAADEGQNNSDRPSMNAGLVIAVDAMSGDHGPIAVPAALDVLAATPDLTLLLVGRGEVLRRLLGSVVPARCSIVEAVRSSRWTSARRMLCGVRRTPR